MSGYLDATGTSARFNSPVGVLFTSGKLYVGELSNFRVRQMDVSSRMVTTLAGSGTSTSADGTGTAASFGNPIGITGDGTSRNLYVADSGGNSIRVVNVDSRVVTTLAGSTGGVSGFVDTAGTNARFRTPTGLVWTNGMLYVTDSGNHVVRRVV